MLCRRPSQNVSPASTQARAICTWAKMYLRTWFRVWLLSTPQKHNALAATIGAGTSLPAIYRLLRSFIISGKKASEDDCTGVASGAAQIVGATLHHFYLGSYAWAFLRWQHGTAVTKANVNRPTSCPKALFDLHFPFFACYRPRLR